MKKYIFFTSLFIFLAFGNVFAQRTVPKDTVIVLERYGCFGICPPYKLTISADGTVIFEPESYYDDASGKYFMSGKYTKSKISQEKVLQIIAEFEAIKFLSLDETYGNPVKEYEPTANCPKVWTDMTATVTSIQMNGKRKRVSHYNGCEGTDLLEKLTEFENKIDKIVNTKQWIRLETEPVPASKRKP